MQTTLEDILISSYKKEMISFMDTNPEFFEKAIKLAISDKPLYSWRAAWLLWSCMKDNDRRIKRYVKDIINALTTKNDNHQRELLKILLQMELDSKYESFLFDFCVTIWEQINKKPSVRHVAFKFITKIAKKHPELSHEITYLIQNHYLESLSPAVKKSISKMIKH
jgi:hypothetical protein